MEMCYDGALVMPKNFVAVAEEEMTYVEGGYYVYATNRFTSGNEAYTVLNRYAKICWAVFACGTGASTAGGALVGALVGKGPGAIVGALLGAVGGAVASVVMVTWAQELDYAAMDARRIGKNSCYVTTEVNNLTLRVTVE